MKYINPRKLREVIATLNELEKTGNEQEEKLLADSRWLLYKALTLNPNRKQI